jgi:hypothetical protein
MALSGAQVTRLSPFGTPMGQYGDFSGKVEQEIVETVSRVGTSLTEKQFRALERKQREAQRRARMIARDDDEIISLLY